MMDYGHENQRNFSYLRENVESMDRTWFFFHRSRRLIWSYSLSACDNFKSQIKPAIKLFHMIISMINDCYLYAFNSTQKWTAKLKAEMRFKIVTKGFEKDKLTIFMSIVQDPSTRRSDLV
jgi:hypothetical protein